MITLVAKMFSLTMAREAALNRGQEMELLLVQRRKMLSQKSKIWRKIVSTQSTNGVEAKLSYPRLVLGSSCRSKVD